MPHRDKEVARLWRNNWYQKHKDELAIKRKTPEWREYQRKAQRRWRAKNKVQRAVQAKKYRKAHPHVHVIATREYRHQLRRKVIEHFGGKCVWCGYDKDWRALQIDHINGGGRREFLRNRQGAVPYHHMLLKAKPGEVYQLLCACCNQIKKYERKEFPAWYAPGTPEHREYGGNK